MTTYSKAQVEELLKNQQKEPAKTITFHYDGWSLNELYSMRSDLFYSHWFENEKFANEKHPVGTYTVAFRVSDSNNKTFEEQVAMLPKGESVCPVAIITTAALLSFIETGTDPFEDDWSRCIEQAAVGNRVALSWHEGQFYVAHGWDGDRRDDVVWSSSVRDFEN